MKTTWNFLICHERGRSRNSPGTFVKPHLVGVRLIRWEQRLLRWSGGQRVLPTVKGRPLIVRSEVWDTEKSLQSVESSLQFSHSVVSDSLQPHESQHTGPPCPSPTPGVHSNSRPSSQWCHPAISSSVVPFSSCPQSLSASESFPMRQPFSWGGQSTGVSALASVLPKNTQGWSPLFIYFSKVCIYWA